jgi:hypothetical protein
MRRTTSYADYGTRDGSVIEQATVILWMLLPPFLAPVYWAVAVEQPDGTFDTVMLPSPAGTLSTVNEPLDDVSTAASAAPAAGVTVTVALGIAPPCEPVTVPEKVAPTCAPVGVPQAASNNANPTTPIRVVTFISLFVLSLR